MLQDGSFIARGIRFGGGRVALKKVVNFDLIVIHFLLLFLRMMKVSFSAITSSCALHNSYSKSLSPRRCQIFTNVPSLNICETVRN